MDVVGGTAWDHATTLCRGISCLRPRDGSITNSMGMSLPKDSGWRRIRQPDKQPARIGGHPHSVSEALGSGSQVSVAPTGTGAC